MKDGAYSLKGDKDKTIANWSEGKEQGGRERA